MTVWALEKTLDDLGRENIIDGRDIEKRVEEIESDLDVMDEGDATTAEKAALRIELAALREIVETIEGYSEEKLRDTVLYRDDYFPTYAEEFAENIGSINPAATAWPLMHIDWKAAAEDLQQDYTSVEIEGTDYWFR